MGLIPIVDVLVEYTLSSQIYLIIIKFFFLQKKTTIVKFDDKLLNVINKYVENKTHCVSIIVTSSFKNYLFIIADHKVTMQLIKKLNSKKYNNMWSFEYNILDFLLLLQNKKNKMTIKSYTKDMVVEILDEIFFFEEKAYKNNVTFKSLKEDEYTDRFIKKYKDLNAFLPLSFKKSFFYVDITEYKVEKRQYMIREEEFYTFLCNLIISHNVVNKINVDKYISKK